MARYRDAIVWLLIAATPFVFPGRQALINEIAIIALFALSLDLLLGYAGIVSLGHAAFFGVGGYVAALLTKYGWTEPVTGLLIAALAAAIIGFASAFLVLRGTDLTRLMVTMGVALLLLELANRFTSITGGADGFQGMEKGDVLGLFRFDLAGRTACLYSLATLFALFLLARLITRSPFGLSLLAIKQNRLRATSVGVPAERRLVAIYTVAAAYAGIAGALLTQTTQFVSLDWLEFHRSADVLLVLVIGGAGYLYGGLIGAAIFKLMQDWLSGITPQYWQFWMGLLLVLLVLIGQDRLVAGPRAAWSWLRRRLTPA